VTSTKETCLAEMRASFNEVMAVLDTIPRERLTEVGVTDEWSVRDVLAHEAGYERCVAAALFGDCLPSSRSRVRIPSPAQRGRHTRC
jgi:hypothetical protein